MLCYCSHNTTEACRPDPLPQMGWATLKACTFSVWAEPAWWPWWGLLGEQRWWGIQSKQEMADTTGIEWWNIYSELAVQEGHWNHVKCEKTHFASLARQPFFHFLEQPPILDNYLFVHNMGPSASESAIFIHQFSWFRKIALVQVLPLADGDVGFQPLLPVTSVALAGPKY